MDLNRLRYFRVVVQTGSIRQAATLLKISPGALSRAMKNLEVETGLQLFSHQGQKTNVTEQGQRLFAQSADLIQSYEHMLDFVNNESLKSESRIRLATYGGFLSHALAKICENVNVAMSSLFRLPGALEQALVNHQADLAITHLPVTHPQLTHQHLGEFTMQLFHHPEAFSGESIEEIPLVVPHPPVQGESFDHLTFDGWPIDKYSRNVKYTTETIEFAMQLCRLKKAGVLAPSYLLPLFNESVDSRNRLVAKKLPKEFPTIKHGVYLVYRKGSQHPLAELLAKAWVEVCHLSQSE